MNYINYSRETKHTFNVLMQIQTEKIYRNNIKKINSYNTIHVNVNKIIELNRKKCNRNAFAAKIQKENTKSDMDYIFYKL